MSKQSGGKEQRANKQSNCRHESIHRQIFHCECSIVSHYQQRYKCRCPAPCNGQQKVFRLGHLPPHSYVPSTPMPCLRRRGGNGERRSRAHGVARSHWRVLYHIRRDEIMVRTKSNCRANCRRSPAMLTQAQREAYTVKHIQKGPTLLTTISRATRRPPSL